LQAVECRLRGWKRGNHYQEKERMKYSRAPREAKEKRQLPKELLFSFGREGAGDPFGKAGASEVAAVGLLELVFAFFEGGSIKPSSLQTNG
jgi:hypothetical protein